MNKRCIDMTEAFTPEGIEKLRKVIKEQGKFDTVLTFKQDDVDHHYNVRVTKDNRVLGKEIQMGEPEGLMIVEDEK